MQSREASAQEAVASTATGFVLSLLLQRLLFPALGHDLTLTDNLVVSLAFTLLSVLRIYVIRRVFERLQSGDAQ